MLICGKMQLEGQMYSHAKIAKPTESEEMKGRLKVLQGRVIATNNWVKKCHSEDVAVGL
jgi:hypothetical protein